MPKQRITKEMITEVAFKLLRTDGEEHLLVKNIADALSCSVQPIYSYFNNIEDLRQELSQMSGAVMRDYVSQRIDKENPFKSTGLAHLSFAKEEPHLFKSYFLRNRSNVNSLDDLYLVEASKDMAGHISKGLGISEAAARNLHMNMIIFSTGLSFMLVSAGGSFTIDEMDRMLEDAYNAFLNKARIEGK